MSLNKLEIGNRIKQLRENVFHESRLVFAERCSLSNNHLARLERGEWLMSVETLSNIHKNTGISLEYILFGDEDNNEVDIRKNIDYFLSKCSKDQLDLYYTIILSIDRMNKNNII